jgi:hypothetical protein
MSYPAPQVFVPFEFGNKALNRNLSRQSLISLPWQGGSKNEAFAVIGIVKEIPERHCLPESTLRGWMQKVVKSLPITCKIARPFALHDEAVEKFQSTLKREELSFMPCHLRELFHFWQRESSRRKWDQESGMQQPYRVFAWRHRNSSWRLKLLQFQLLLESLHHRETPLQTVKVVIKISAFPRAIFDFVHDCIAVSRTTTGKDLCNQWRKKSGHH